MKYAFHSFPHLLEKLNIYERMPPWTKARITPQMEPCSGRDVIASTMYHYHGRGAPSLGPDGHSYDEM